MIACKIICWADIKCNEFWRAYITYRGPGVAQWLRRCTTSRTVPGSIPGGVTWDFFRGSFRQNHVPWGRLSLWKWVPGISPGVNAVSAFGWRPTTLVVPKVERIRGLNLPGTPGANSACCGKPLLFLYNVQTYPSGRAVQVRVWGPSLTGIWGSNPAGGMDVCLLWVLCVVR